MNTITYCPDSTSSLSSSTLSVGSLVELKNLLKVLRDESIERISLSKIEAATFLDVAFVCDLGRVMKNEGE